jgi:hypothetical protein
MCVSAWPAIFSKTITGTWEVLVDGKLQHVIWYQNRVGSPLPEAATAMFEEYVQRLVATGKQSTDQAYELSKIGVELRYATEECQRRKNGKPARSLDEVMGGGIGGNCLIIPLMGSWESIRLLNTAGTPKLLSDIDAALKIPLRGVTMIGSWGGASNSAEHRIVFLQFDVYDIVIAERASQI